MISDGWEVPATQAENAGYWANALNPYIKNWGIYDNTGFTKTVVATDADDHLNSPIQEQSTHVTFNGLLHTLSTSEIVEVSKVPMFWSGLHKGAYQGRALSNPALACTAVAPGGPCRFNPSGPPQAGATGGYQWYINGTASAYIFAEGGNYSYTDSSAKFRRAGRRTGEDTTTEPNRDYYGTPWAHIRTSTGQPLTMWGCTAAGATASYSCFFRPDRTE
jgi:hypothetical protein